MGTAPPPTPRRLYPQTCRPPPATPSPKKLASLMWFSCLLSALDPSPEGELWTADPLLLEQGQPPSPGTKDGEDLLSHERPFALVVAGPARQNKTVTSFVLGVTLPVIQQGQ